jgi:hypothetical protein
MIVDIDHALRLADPVRGSVVPGPDSVTGQRIWEGLKVQTPRRTIHMGRRRPLLIGVSMTGVAALVIGVLLAFLPTGVESSGAAAALTQLSKTAANRAQAVTIGPGQWLSSRYDVSASVSVQPHGSTGPASASVSGTVTSWVNSYGVLCVVGSYGVPRFASAADQQAWPADGLATGASTDTQSCGTGQDSGAIDVSSLPSNAQSLADELETGTTGIPALDTGPWAGSSLGNSGFTRAVSLLLGPTTGSAPAFQSTLLSAMATMSGITSLGTETTSSGVAGEAFAASNGVSQTTVILSPTTGQLLEARDLYLFSLPVGFNLLKGLDLRAGLVARVMVDTIEPNGAPAIATPPADLPGRGGAVARS